MPNTANVTTGKPKVAGAVYRAPAGTAVPTDATTALAQTYIDMGYISEDGVTNNNSADSENVKAWGGAVVLTTPGEKTDEWTMTFIEALNETVLKAVYGTSNVTIAADGKITVKANSDAPEEAVYVIDMVLKGGALKRVVIPNGSLSELGEIVYKDDEPVGYEVTLSALPDAQGNTHYEYIVPAT